LKFWRYCKGKRKGETGCRLSVFPLLAKVLLPLLQRIQLLHLLHQPVAVAAG